MHYDSLLNITALYARHVKAKIGAEDTAVWIHVSEHTTASKDYESHLSDSSHWRYHHKIL